MIFLKATEEVILAIFRLELTNLPPGQGRGFMKIILGAHFREIPSTHVLGRRLKVTRVSNSGLYASTGGVPRVDVTLVMLFAYSYVNITSFYLFWSCLIRIFQA